MNPHDQLIYLPGEFTHDSTDAVFPGFTTGSLWNGWATPAFTRQVAEQVALLHDGTYDAARDAFVFAYDPEGYPGFDAETADGPRHLYAIGAYAWCWYEPEDRETAAEPTLSLMLLEALNTVRQVEGELTFHGADALPDSIRVLRELADTLAAAVPVPRVGADLTEREETLLAFVISHVTMHGYQPSMREIAAHLGVRSTGTVSDVCRALTRKGYLKPSRGPRCLRVNELRVEVIPGLVPREQR